ncbi:hypothetical protein HK101_006982, partial [Irineochytrium annulatum]
MTSVRAPFREHADNIKLTITYCDWVTTWWKWTVFYNLIVIYPIQMATTVHTHHEWVDGRWKDRAKPITQPRNLHNGDNWIFLNRDDDQILKPLILLEELVSEQPRSLDLVVK